MDALVYIAREVDPTGRIGEQFSRVWLLHPFPWVAKEGVASVEAVLCCLQGRARIAPEGRTSPGILCEVDMVHGVSSMHARLVEKFMLGEGAVVVKVLEFVGYRSGRSALPPER